MTQKPFFSVIREVVANGDMRMLRLWLALGGLLWGVALLIPHSLFSSHVDLFDACGYLIPFAKMRMLVITHVFSVIVGVMFLVQSCSVFYCVVYDRVDRALLISDAVLGCALWTTMVVAVLSLHVAPTPVAGSLMAMLASWWNLIRFIVDAPNGPN